MVMIPYGKGKTNMGAGRPNSQPFLKALTG